VAKFIALTSKALSATFYVCKAEQHFAVCNNNQTASSCAQPGDYIALDKHFNVLVFGRQQFKAVFGHKMLEKLDQEIEGAAE